jgi:demethylmenaquinone methyltransferase/2-methoxy-6-polyprenyl-1,4-benzoquinol methylase
MTRRFGCAEPKQFRALPETAPSRQQEGRPTAGCIERPVVQLDGKARATYVRTMFGRIAPRYDLMNGLMTGGRDRAWRRLAVREAALPPGGRLLDVATGTGDLALEALRRDSRVRGIGADFSLEMMQRGRTKNGAGSIGWTGADALRLPFPDDSFDAVTSGFMMRNVTDVARAFAEQRRVTRPGGRVVCLEISPTPAPVFRHLFRFYFYNLVPIIGGLVSGQAEAYTYLPNSLTGFLTAGELAEVMRSVGLRQVYFRHLMVGTVAIHVGVKE